MTTPDYSKYIKTSIQIVKTNKWLWLFAALAGGGGSVSVGSNVSDIFKNFDPTEKKDPGILKEIPQTTANVLGDTTSAITDWLKTIPPEKWILFILMVAALAAIGIITVLVITNWARGSLIKGIDNAEKGEKVTLSNTSPLGFKYLKNLVHFSFIEIFFLLLLLGMIPFVWTLIFLIFINIPVLKIIWAVFGILTVPIGIFVFIVLSTLIVAYGERLIVLNDMEPTDAMKKAVFMSRKTLLPGILMGIINKIIGFTVGIAEIAVLAIVTGIPAYLTYLSFEKNSVFSVILGTLTLMSLTVFIFFSQVVRAALVTLGYSNWNQLFNDLVKSEKASKEENYE